MEKEVHQLIYGLVYADSPGSAVETAKESVFEPLIERGRFDYAVTFSEDGRGIAGSDRWGNLPTAVPAETNRGEELIDRGWSATKAEYRHGFDRIQEFLDEHEPRSFWKNREIHAEYMLDFRRVGEFYGPSTFLYDQHGEGIRHRDHLNQVQNYWEDLQNGDNYENQELYVVPADIHL